MDLVTQIALGATVGQFGFQKILGRRAIAYGALAGLIPDLDVVVKLSSNPYAEILHHRGLTHSLFFGLIVGIGLGWILWKAYHKKDPLSSWIGLMIWGLVTHPLLDLFTIYGTQLLYPLSDHRFALSSVAIIDPVYTIPLLISIVVGLVYKNRITLSTVWSGLTLFLTTCYLFLGLLVNDQVAHKVTHAIHNKVYREIEGPVTSINVYTTMLQLPLRRVVVQTEKNMYVGFTSWFHQDKKISWQSMEKAPVHLTKDFINTPDFKIFSWFTNHQYVISAQKLPSGDVNLMVRDSRYGFMDDETTFGLWGLKTTVNNDGKVIGPTQKAGLNRKKLLERLTDIPELFRRSF